MAVIGMTTQMTYVEADIFSARYAAMQEESLLREEDDSLVIPVRNRSRPHFRIVAPGGYRRRLGPSERDDATHDAAITHLLGLVTNRRLTISTNVFGTDLEESGSHVLFRQQSQLYHWFREHDCRIPLGGGRYIEPDLCGRDARLFQPTSQSPGIIIEVIHTHPPDEATYLVLERLSQVGYLVVFFFVPREGTEAQYNRIFPSTDGSAVEIRPALYLAGGCLFRNGEVIERYPGRTDSAWYSYVSAGVFDRMQAAKR